MLLGKARLKLLLFGGFFLISVFCYRISALRLSQEDGCVEKKEESLVPLISVAPLQQGSSQSLRPQCDRKAHSIPAPTRPQQTPATTRRSPGQGWSATRCPSRLAGGPALTELAAWLTRHPDTHGGGGGGAEEEGSSLQAQGCH